MLNKDELKNIKLIVFDLDGTLLNDEGQIGIETKKLVKKLASLGVQFTFATKRLQSSIKEYAEELNINTPLISLDGALVQSRPTNITVYESFVPEKYVQKAIFLADKFLLKICLCHPEAIYYTNENSSILSMLDKFGATFKEIPTYDDKTNRTLEVVIAGEQFDAIHYLNNQLKFPNSFGLETSYFQSYFREGIFYLEIRKGGSSKGKSLHRLIKHLKIKIGHTVVIGDWYNDMSLFKTRAIKVAVANAVPEIKRLSNFITKHSNNEDGVSDFLELVLKYKIGK
jgi:Cof subfamily protein (haloacid dehalogenase superfamily)